MNIQVIGCGNAFGAGGRFNTCFLVTGAGCRFLIDCGASSMVALNHFGIDPNSLDGAVISHLHGDHFGGLPFLLLDAHYPSRRDRPFFIYGPPGTATRLAATQEALFPGSSGELRFPVEIREMSVEQRCDGPGFAVTPYLADHSADSVCFCLRFDCDGKVVTFSGDTAWTEALPRAAQGADLLLVECSSYEKPLPGHQAYRVLAPHLPGIGAKRVIITHMDPDMLDRRDSLDYETATDGMTLTL